MVVDEVGCVAFLDAPEVGVEELAAAIGHAVALLGPGGGVLTVFTREEQADRVVASACEESGLGHVATLRHPAGGTTYTLRAVSQSGG